MSYLGNLKISNTAHLVGSTLYGTCSTAAGTAAKVVTCSNFDKLLTGVTIHVKFDNSNTVANPTLNVNSTGAKNIYRYKTTAPGTDPYTSWISGAVVSFTYDGSAWIMNDWLNSDTHYYRPIKVNGTQILATSSATALDLVAGSNVTLTNSSGAVTITSQDTKYTLVNDMNDGGGLCPKIEQGATSDQPYFLKAVGSSASWAVPANATTSYAGYMSATDKTFIEGLKSKNNIIVIDVPSFSSLPQTVTNSLILENHVLLRYELGTPSAQESDWTVTITAGSATISGTMVSSTSTTLRLILGIADNLVV